MLSPSQRQEVPEFDSTISAQSASNFAILDENLKQNFIQAVNILRGTNHSLDKSKVSIYEDSQFGRGKWFQSGDKFYEDIHRYMKVNNPDLLTHSIRLGDGVTNSEIAKYMIYQSGVEQVGRGTHRQMMSVTPEGDTAVKETAQNLSGLKALLVEKIKDQSKETDVIKEVEDIEQKKSSIINSPPNFKEARTKEIQDVLNILPPEGDRVFTEKMLNYLMLGGLIQNGVIPYIDIDGTTKIDFTPQCSPAIKTAWKGVADNANAYIPPETLKGFIAYTSTSQNPNATMGIIKSRLPNNTAPTAENILKVASIPNSQKSLALTTLKNNNSATIIEPLVAQAATDAAQFKQANISDTLQMVTNQTSQFEDLAKKGQLPKNEKEWADLIRSPVREAGKRFGAAGSLLVLFGGVMLAWKAGTTLADKMSGGKAKWFGKTLGFITALAGFSVGSNILGNYIENIPLEKIDPNKSDKEKKKLRNSFGKLVWSFDTDVFPGLFILSEGFGRDTNNRPFSERVTAEKIFSQGTPPVPFDIHPNVMDQTPELTIDGKKATPQMLDSYKAIYRAVYFRRKNLMDAREKETNIGKRDDIFPESLLDPGTKTLQQYLAEFYKKIPNKNELPRVEGFDMAPERMRNFGLTSVPILDQSKKVDDINKRFTGKALTGYPATNLTTYDKKPYDITLGNLPNQDTLQIPVWDPSELKDSAWKAIAPKYEWTPDGADYLVQITDTSTWSPRISRCILSETRAGSKIFAVKQMSVNGVAYTK